MLSISGCFKVRELFVSCAFDLSNPNKNTTKNNENIKKEILEEEIRSLESLPGSTTGQGR